ncbi:MAG TPA: hypothetical protein VK625_22620, partial [Flavitalea sp.]|nr:hypothetical protein [Flavitalea sp.]
SCSKLDWKRWHKGDDKFLVPSCDVQKVYAAAEGGGVDVEMKKTYYGNGQVKTVGFYTHSALGGGSSWHSFQLNYNATDLTVDIIDSANGEVVLKAVFNASGRLEELESVLGDTSDYAYRRFDYDEGHLLRIYGRWKTFDFIETFSYDANGNIVRHETVSSDGTVTEDAKFTYGAAAGDNRQFYIPQFNYLTVVDPSMALIEYLGWVKDFSPKNILTRIEYLQPLPQADDFTGHVFNGGKLTSYTINDFVGGTKHIDWRCTGLLLP